MNQKLDGEIKAWLKKNDTILPQDMDEKINNTLQLTAQKKYSKKKVLRGNRVRVLVGVLLLGSISVYAANTPIVKNILKIFSAKTYENYDRYASDLNIAKQSKGIKITIDKVVYDKVSLVIMYTLEPQEPMLYRTSIRRPEFKINGKALGIGYSETGEIAENGKAYTGLITYSLEDIPNIPEQFVLELNIDSVETSVTNEIKRGKWQFEIPLSSQDLSNEIKEIECNIKLNTDGKNVTINKIIITPINTVIQGIATEEYNNSFIVLDDKGRVIEAKGGSYGSEDGSIYQFSYQFKEIFDDTEELIFIPYNDRISISELIQEEKYMNQDSLDVVIDEGNNTISKSNETVRIGKKPSKVEQNLNLEGETRILTKGGEEYTTITRVIVEENKTKVYYKSKYLMFGSPQYIIDNQIGEKILPTDDFERMYIEDWRYIAESKECVVTFNKELKSKEYKVGFVDQSECMAIYLEETFKIEID